MRQRSSAAAASKPSITGMLMSSATTSGSSCARELDRLAAVGRPPDDLDPRLAREHGLERLGEETVIVRDQHSDRRDGLPAHLDPNAILPV